jgi:hypothetical protein
MATLVGLLDPEDEGTAILRNVGKYPVTHCQIFYYESNLWVSDFEFGCLVAMEKEHSSSIFRKEYCDFVTYFRV